VTGAASNGDALADRYDAVFGRLERLENALRTEIQTQTDRAEAAEAQLRALGDLTARADELVATAHAEAARLSREANQEFDLAAQAHQEAMELRAEAERLATKAAAEHAAAAQQLAAAQHAAAAQDAAAAQLAAPLRQIDASEAAAAGYQSASQRLAASNLAAAPTPGAEGATSGEELLLAIRRYLTDMLTLEEVTVATAGAVDHRAGGGPRLQLLRSNRRSGDDEDQRNYDEQRANR